MSIAVAVRGMTCQHCVAAITSAVSAVPGVTEVDVDLADAVVRVDGTADRTIVAAAIADAGYDVGHAGASAP